MPHTSEDLVNVGGYTVEAVDRNFIPSNKQGKAQILWVGCSSSWITECNVLDLEPDEVFVHRNLGNVLSYADLSSESAIEYALDVLKVSHIIICGHYDCKLKKNEFLDGIHSWGKDRPTHFLESKVVRAETPERSAETERQEELHVLREVQWVKQQKHVARIIQERDLQVHGFVFDKEKTSCVRLVGSGSD